MMKIHASVLALLTAVMVAAAGDPGETTGVDTNLFGFDASVEAASAHIFRGATLNDGWVLQPATLLKLGPARLGLAGTYDLTDYSGAVDQGEFSSIDLLASLKAGFGGMTIEAGYRAYLDQYYYPDAVVPELNTPAEQRAYEQELQEKRELYPRPDLAQDDAGEFFVSLAYASLLQPSLSVSHGVDGFLEDTTYIVAGLGHDYYRHKGWTLGILAELYNVQQDGGPDGFSHCQFTHTMTCRFMTAKIGLTAPLDRDILAKADEGGPLDIRGYGSLGFLYSF